MDRSKIEAKVASIAGSAAKSLGLVALDVEMVKEYGEWYLRIYIEKEGGVGIEDCASLSEILSVELDRLDIVPESYLLEVTSSGEKPIRRDEEYDRFNGRYAMINTFKPVAGSKSFVGYLRGTSGGNVLIDTDGVVIEIPKSAISKARLAVPF